MSDDKKRYTVTAHQPLQRNRYGDVQIHETFTSNEELTPEQVVGYIARLPLHASEPGTTATYSWTVIITETDELDDDAKDARSDRINGLLSRASSLGAKLREEARRAESEQRAQALDKAKQEAEQKERAEYERLHAKFGPKGS